MRKKIKDELNNIILPEEVPKEEFKRVTDYLLTIGWFDNYIELRFEKYLKDNWAELVEKAEAMTGEKYDGLEPLLTKEEIIKIAKDIWVNDIITKEIK